MLLLLLLMALSIPLLRLQLQVDALDGRSIAVPLGPGPVQPGAKLLVKGEGMPVSKAAGQKGDLIVTVKVQLPRLSEQQRQALKTVLQQ
jgi:DnaJ-class molecular chaperone